MNKFGMRNAVTTTLILATALVTFGCRQPLQGADMTKPVTRQSEPDVKPERRTLDAVPVPQEKDIKSKKDALKPEKIELAPLLMELPVKKPAELK